MRRAVAVAIVVSLCVLAPAAPKPDPAQELLTWVNVRRQQANLQELALYGEIRDYRAPLVFDDELADAAEGYAALFSGEPFGPPPGGLADGLAQLFWRGHSAEYISEVWGSRPYDDPRAFDEVAARLCDPRWSRAGIGRSRWKWDIDTVAIQFGE